MFILLGQLDKLSEQNRMLQARLAIEQDEKEIVQTIGKLAQNTGEMFKKKILMDRELFNVIGEGQKEDYARLKTDYLNLIDEHKMLCNKYSDLEYSSNKEESARALQHGEDLRVGEILALDHKPSVFSVEGFQRCQF